MQARTSSNSRIRFRGNDYGTTRCISFGGHEKELIEVWQMEADESGSTLSGVFKKHLRVLKQKRKERYELNQTLCGASL